MKVLIPLTPEVRVPMSDMMIRLTEVEVELSVISKVQGTGAVSSGTVADSVGAASTRTTLA